MENLLRLPTAAQASILKHFLSQSNSLFLQSKKTTLNATCIAFKTLTTFSAATSGLK